MTISRMQQPRQMYQDGSILPRLNQLGSGVSSAEQTLQEINQRLDSAESTLGGGDPANGLMAIQPNNFQPTQMPIGQPQLSVANYTPFAGETFNQVPEQFRAGFDKYTKENPIGIGGQAISYSMLPDGNRVSFGDTASAGAFSDYLNSIGQGVSPIGTATAIQSPIASAMMGRQNYGLGSLVKSIGKGVKKFVKSDLGKAAIGAALTFGLPGVSTGFFSKGLMGTKAGSALSGFFGKGSFNPFLKKVAGDQVLSPFGMIGKKLGITNLSGGLTGVGKMAATIIPSVMAAAGVKQEDIPELQQNKPQLMAALERGYRNLNLNASDDEVAEFVRTYSAEGGRIKYANGSEDYEDRFMKLVAELREAGFSQQEAIEEARERLSENKAMGGRIGYAMGDSAEQNAVQASGIMGLPLNENPAGVTELDLRETGGFIPPVGVKEKADDIPAMLSNNEFVFTADAVRGMGDGDVDKGAERMYSMMKTLENGGRV